MTLTLRLLASLVVTDQRGTNRVTVERTHHLELNPRTMVDKMLGDIMPVTKNLGRALLRLWESEHEFWPYALTDADTPFMVAFTYSMPGDQGPRDSVTFMPLVADVQLVSPPDGCKLYRTLERGYGRFLAGLLPTPEEFAALARDFPPPPMEPDGPDDETAVDE